MTSRAHAFGPEALTRLHQAFEVAWRTVEPVTSERNRDRVREDVAKAVMDLAKAGRADPTHLANYAVYRGRFTADMTG
jgi:hypothetical protein